MEYLRRLRDQICNPMINTTNKNVTKALISQTDDLGTVCTIQTH